MVNKPDIQIKEVEKVKYHVKTKTLATGDKYSYKVPIPSKLVLEFSGKDVNNILVNTLRRVSMDDIPSYAFYTDLIKITDNTTIFNNDMMRCRLEQLPIPNLKSELFHLDNKYWKNVDYSDPKRTKHPKEQLIECYINSYNDTNEIKNVTTNNIRFYENGEEILHKYNTECPFTLIQLRPAETFKCYMKAALGVGARHNIWSAVSTAYYDDYTTDDLNGGFVVPKDKKITFTIESLGQYDEYDILEKACKFIKKKLEDIKNDIIEKVKTKNIQEKNEMVFVFDGEDHTIGNLMNDAFQDHPDIIFSGLAKPDHFIKSIKITVCSEKNKTPYKAILAQMDVLISKFDFMEKEFN